MTCNYEAISGPRLRRRGLLLALTRVVVLGLLHLHIEERLLCCKSPVGFTSPYLKSCYHSFHTKLSNLSLCYGLVSSILSFLGLRSISALLLFLCYGSLRLLEKAPILKLSVNYVLLPRLKEIQSQSHSSSDSAVS
ncbi:hypothetical protein Lal_00019079 [Lupinus albus]|nr:hypothetical protein Lal_00019079 [Lupinus albus]